jgi:hypothetical protein
MLTLPQEILPVAGSFAPLFTPKVFEHLKVLLVGLLLTPGRHTVASALRMTGREQDPHFQSFHRVLNRDRWSGLGAAKILLGWLVRLLVPTGPVVVGGDDTLQRRRGAHIAAKGIYRDPVRSSRSFFVKVSALRWLVLGLLVSVPFAGGVWALPFLALLCPSERYDQGRHRRHRTLQQRTLTALRLVRRWLPGRQIVAVLDGAFAVLEFLDSCVSYRIQVVTRLRLDAALYDPAPVRQPHQRGAPRKKGDRQPTLQQRLTDPKTVWQRVRIAHWYRQGPRVVEMTSGTSVWYHAGKPVVPVRWVLVRPLKKQSKRSTVTFEPQAFLCTDLQASPVQIAQWYIQRWPLEVTFQEARAHLGLETQRQWNPQAIERTTPLLLGLYSLVAVWGQWASDQGALKARQAAWYPKITPTFSDALAYVRRQLWNQAFNDMSRQGIICMSETEANKQIMPDAFIHRLIDALCYAY